MLTLPCLILRPRVSKRHKACDLGHGRAGPAQGKKGCLGKGRGVTEQGTSPLPLLTSWLLPCSVPASYWFLPHMADTGIGV